MKTIVSLALAGLMSISALLPALAALPDGDAALLQDAMSDEDYQTFLELLGL